MPFVVSLNVQLTHPRLVVNPTTGVRDAIMGYWKMVVVDAPDADRARDLACGTVNDGMVVESKHSECDFGGLKPAIASALSAVTPCADRLVVVGGLIYYGR